MKHQYLTVAAALVATSLTTAVAGELPRSDPADVGLSAERLAAVDQRLDASVEAKLFPGAVILVARNGKIAHVGVHGKLTPGGPDMTEDAIFRIYSMTKPIVTVAAMTLVEQGRLGLAYPVSAYLPEFKEMKVATSENDANGSPVLEAAVRPITVRDVMRHTSGIAYDFYGDGPARDAYVAAGIGDGSRALAEEVALLATMPLEHQPGTTWEYSRSLDVLGRIIEVLTGQPLGEALDAIVFTPLGMEDTGYHVADERKFPRIADAYADHKTLARWNGMADPRVKPKFEPGGSGLVSTVHDYARFAQMMMNGGELDGVRILSRKSVELMTSDHIADGIRIGTYDLLRGSGFGLGFSVRRPGATLIGSPGTYGWGGAAGTMYVADPEEKMFYVLMVQSFKNRSAMRVPMTDMIASSVVD